MMAVRTLLVSLLLLFSSCLGDEGEQKLAIIDSIVHYRLEAKSNFPTAFGQNISEQCRSDSINYMNAYLTDVVPWALQMYDATGKMPEGFYVLSNSDAPGLFDQCLGIKAPLFTGKYCTVYFRREPVDPSELLNATSSTHASPALRNNWLYFYQLVNLIAGGPNLIEPKERDSDLYSTFDPSAGYCIPSSCSAEDFRKSVAQLVGAQALGNETIGYSSLVSMTDESECFTLAELEEPPKFDGPDVTVLVLLSVIGALILGATIYDILCSHYVNHQTSHDSFLARFTLCFSAYRNGVYLLSSKASVTDNLACLNGLRVLSTTWIVLYHVYYVMVVETVYNRQDFMADARTWHMHGALNASIAVDTFFVMSGLLVAYSLMKELDRNNGKFNIIMFYVHRYLRLTIVYAFILGFIATLVAHMGAGPFWHMATYLSKGCRVSWWNNLLYINNYVHSYPRDCMPETWYLAAEMQMFVLSPVFIYLLWRSRKIGLVWSLFVILASLGGTLTIFIVWNLPPMGFFTRTDANDNPYYYAQYYVQMWTRWPPYILGMLLGWFLHVTKGQRVKLSKTLVTVGWCSAIALGLAVIYGMAPYADQTKAPEIGDAVRVLYGTFHRFAWAVAVSWIIFACLHGYGGFINRLLSWNTFIPLARLTYVVYLVHLNYLYVYHAQVRKPVYYTNLEMAQSYFGTVLLVFLLAFAICLSIEVPFSNLERLLLPSKKRTVPGKSVGVEESRKQ